MVRKLSCAAMTVAVLALAAPSLASASLLTNFGGEAVPVGEQFEIASANTLITTENLGTIVCNSLEDRVELTTNGPGGVVAAESLGFGFGSGSGCLLHSESEVWIPQFEIRELEMTSATEGSAFLKAELLLTKFLECEVSGPVSVSYKFKGNSIHILGSALEGGPCGGVVISDDFALNAGFFSLD